MFMDAYSTVTAEEGDRYPLRPPEQIGVENTDASTVVSDDGMLSELS